MDIYLIPGHIHIGQFDERMELVEVRHEGMDVHHGDKDLECHNKVRNLRHMGHAHERNGIYGHHLHIYLFLGNAQKCIRIYIELDRL